MRFLQYWPRQLEMAYVVVYGVLHLFRRELTPGGRMEKIFVRGEKIIKGPLFGCQMCGDCVLRSTGMTCPMTCPKDLRNGPCGGVLLNGHCEITPKMLCVWMRAWERSRRMSAHGDGMLTVLTPLDRSLSGTSAWINDLHEDKVKNPPVGWTD